jgi:hypothetical protein
MANERGRKGFQIQAGSGKKSKTIDTGYYYVPKVDIGIKRKDLAGEGTLDLGKFSITAGGAYGKTVQTVQPFTRNKVALPPQINKQIYQKASVGLGIKLPKDLKISGFIDRERIKGDKGRNTKTLQLSGKLLGGNFVGSISDSEGGRVGKFEFRLPFTPPPSSRRTGYKHGGKVHRGRKAKY